MWQLPVTRMAVPLFGWVCEAYPCPTNAIFPQLEFIQTLSEEFERGTVSVSYTVRLTGVAQATGHTYKRGQGFFGRPFDVTTSENGSQSFRPKRGLSARGRTVAADRRPSCPAGRPSIFPPVGAYL